MAHPSVTAFVEQASGSDSLKQRLQSANLSELLAIAREHDLHMGEADALYAHAKHGMELWGIGHAVEAPSQSPRQSAPVGALLDQVKTSPELKQKLENADLEQLLSMAKAHNVDLGHAQDLYDKAREQLEIW